MRTKKTEPLNIGQFGKIPPQAVDLEEAILGAILLEKNSIDNIIDVLVPECFYMETHQRIFAAMRKMYENNTPIDLLTVTEELKYAEHLELIGGPYALMKLTNKVGSAANIETHARIVYQKHLQREIIKAGMTMTTEGYADSCDPFELLDASEKALSTINYINNNKYHRGHTIAFNVLKKVEELNNSTNKLTGVDTGFRYLNHITAGWQPEDLIIIAARPSMGKTALGLSFTLSALRKGVGVGFFSLEMSKEKIMSRMMSADSSVELQKILRGEVSQSDYDHLHDSAVRISKYNFIVDDTSAPTVYQIRAKARKMKREEKIGMIVVDYIQLMAGIQNGRPDNREQEIAKISRDLKGIAKELKIPVIALSQLSRDVERRQGKKLPQLSDLRESGALEQDADFVAFIYRPEYYEIHNDDKGNSTSGLTEIKIAKHRNGALDIIKLKANLSIQRFTEWDNSQNIDFTYASTNGLPINGTNKQNVDRFDEEAPF